MKKKLVIVFGLLTNCLCATSPQLLKIIKGINDHALGYVGNIPENGAVQLDLLLREGLKKDNYVLEIGCGALVASIPIMSFLEPEHFVGIDPNKWLIDASLKIPQNLAVINQARPLFLYNENFDASVTDIQFDYIISHSIISHAPLWQFKLFLQNCAKVLKDGGKIIFSLRLTEPNEFDPTGKKEESTTDKWQYPTNTYFHKSTVINEASKWFKKIEYKKEYTPLLIAVDNPKADTKQWHDWFVLTK